jgi:hypothetical protein
MSNTPTIEQISEMGVSDAKPLLPKLSREDLTALKVLEEGKGEDKARTTLLAAIDALLDDPDEPRTIEERVAAIEEALATGDITGIAMRFAR